MQLKHILPALLLTLLVAIGGFLIEIIPQINTLLFQSTDYNLQVYAFELLTFGIGALFSIQRTRWLTDRFGYRSVLTLGIVFHLFFIFFAGTSLIFLTVSLIPQVLFFITCFVYGLALGLLVPFAMTLIYVYYPKRFFFVLVLLFGFRYFSSFFASLMISSENIVFFFGVLFVLNIFIFFAFEFFLNYPQFPKREEKKKVSSYFWTLFVAILLIGFLETLFFNWSDDYINAFGKREGDLKVAQLIMLSLSAGRFFVALLLWMFSGRSIYFWWNNFFLLLTLILYFYFKENHYLFVLSEVFFIFSFLPLIAAFAIQSDGKMAHVMAGKITAGWICGYLIGAFLFAELLHFKILELKSLFQITTIVSVLFCLINIFVLKHLKMESETNERMGDHPN